MDILKILKKSPNELILEDLDFFETELATGEGYTDEYIKVCKKKIKELRYWLNGESVPKEEEPKKEEENDEVPVWVRKDLDSQNQANTSNDIPKGIVISVGEVVPEGAGLAIPKISPAQQVQSDLKSLRNRTDYKSAFKKYAKASTTIDADFLDKNFAIFDSWEMDAIVSVKQLGEEFLEKYFGAIDHDKIARYQLFSEGFFMKHFAQMDAGIVLEHGKNEWRKKENRSKQLDVFLRLKGVKI